MLFRSDPESVAETPAQPPHFEHVSTDARRTCAVDTNGDVSCWGVGFRGKSRDDVDLAQVSLGYSHACGISSKKRVICWGDDGRRQASPPSGTFEQVSAGYIHSCAVETSGTIQCWGSNEDGGDILNERTGQADPPSGRFIQVSAGHLHTCAVKRSGEVVCWEIGRASCRERVYCEV